MAQVQVQFIIGQFAVNHIIPEGNLEEVKKEFFAEYSTRLQTILGSLKTLSLNLLRFLWLESLSLKKRP